MWVLKVCQLGPEPVLISLLGLKHGMSEYSFYSFYGAEDNPADYPGKLSFHEWLSGLRPEIELVEHPTVDFVPVPAETLDAIASDVTARLSQGKTVLIVDSGGQERTKQVCDHLGAKEASHLMAAEYFGQW